MLLDLIFVIGTGCMSTGYHTPTLSAPIRLTKDTLLQTQKHRAMDVCPQPEAFAGYVTRNILSIFFLQPACRVAFFFYCYFFLMCDVVFSCTVVWALTPHTIPIILYPGKTVRCNQLAVIRMQRQNLILCHWLTVLCKYDESFRWRRSRREVGSSSSTSSSFYAVSTSVVLMLLKFLWLIGYS